MRVRHEIEQAAARLLQERIDAYGLGLVVTGVAFQDVHPPLAVVDAYRDVSRAASDRQRRVNEGETYRAETRAQAQGKAAVIVNRAESLRATAVARASGEADAFIYKVEARRSAPALTDLRLYWETIASTLAGRPKLLLDRQPGHTRHLIVPGPPGSTAPLLKTVAPAPR